MADQLPPDRAATGESPRKEARDTVAGCRDRAASDRLQAASTDTENSRHVFERSAASWEARADQIEEGEHGSERQRAADRELWASEEDNGAISPDRRARAGADPWRSQSVPVRTLRQQP
jgi:hypothetical protein